MVGFNERYEIGDVACGVIEYTRTFRDALSRANRIHPECLVTIFDRMAHQFAPQQWDREGREIAWRDP